MALRRAALSLPGSALWKQGPNLSQRNIYMNTVLKLRQNSCLATSHNTVKTPGGFQLFGKDQATANVNCGRQISSSVESVRPLSYALRPEARVLDVTWSNGEQVSYPYVWLRDVCQCPKCWHEASTSRFLLMADLDVECQIDDIQVQEDKGRIEVTWSDGHLSPYPFDWLEERAFTDRCRQKRWNIINQKPIIWDRAYMQNNLPTANFKQIMEDSATLLHWISELEVKGMFLIRNAPCEEDQVLALGKRVGQIRTTNYGSEFTVKSKMNASNAAYTTATLGFHTDLAYYNYVPGMQMLHCITQVPSKGGENQFVDGFHVANLLKETDHVAFQILSTTPVDNSDIGTDYFKFHLIKRHPVIRLDKFGDLDQITFNNQTRDSFLTVPVEQVNTLFRAMKKFNELCYDPSNHIEFKMEAGDIACFHNYRVLHARTGYEMLESGERHLQGGYIDWDVMLSRRRVLLDELGISYT